MGRKKLIPVLLLMAAFVGVAAYAGSQLYDSHEEYAVGDEAYEQIAKLVITEDPDASSAAQETAQAIAAADGSSGAVLGTALQGTLAATGETAALVDIPRRTVDYTALREINEDAIGWLYCPDTVIDYPVMGAADYEYYLRHLPDGTYNINGSLFLDYNNQWDFSDQLSVIYGHNMKTEKMFGTLVNYKQQDYFDEHPYLYLYTPTQNYRIALLYGAVVSSTQWGQEGFALDAEALLAYAKANTTFTSAVQYTGDEKLVALSTCSYEYEDARYFVVGVLQPAQ
jgi:sortase B